MRSLKITFLSFFCGCGAACAQVAEPFETLSIDRPDVSNLPTTIRPGHFQFEMGSSRGFGTSISEAYLPNIVFRTGVTRRSELRLGFDYLRLDSLGTTNISKQLFLMVGGKYRFIEERDRRPAVALQAEFAIPTEAGTGFNYDRDDYNLAAMSLVLLFNNTINDQVFINYNAGFFWSRADLADWLLSASFSFLHTHRLGYFMEVYSLIVDKSFPVSFDGGLMFLLSPRVQVDIYGGQKAVETERMWFYGAGLGFRLDRGDLKPRSFNSTGIHH